MARFILFFLNCFFIISTSSAQVWVRPSDWDVRVGNIPFRAEDKRLGTVNMDYFLSPSELPLYAKKIKCNGETYTLKYHVVLWEKPETRLHSFCAGIELNTIDYCHEDFSEPTTICYNKLLDHFNLPHERRSLVTGDYIDVSNTESQGVE